MNLFTQSNATSLVLLVMLGLVLGWVLFRTHRALAKHRGSWKPGRPQRPKRADPGHHVDSPPDVLRWEVQMHETARELSGQLDSKMRVLQALITDADRAAARLETAMGETPPATQAEALMSSDGPRQAESTVEPTGDSTSQDRREEVYTLSDYGLGPAEVAARIGRPIGEIELILSLRYKG